MKKIFVNVFLVVGLLIFINSCKIAQNATTSNFNFDLQKGKTYEYHMDYDMLQQMQGQEMNTDMKIDYTIEVVDDNDGIKTLKTTYDRFMISMDAGGMTLVADSDDTTALSAEVTGPEDMMRRMMRALEGKTFMMKVNKEGKVLEVTGFNEIYQSMINEMGLSEEMKPAAQQAMSQQFNDEAVKEMFSQSFNIFPAKPVKVGDSWEKTISGSAAMPMNTITTYTVKAIEGNMVTLDLVSKINLTGEANLTGTQTGTMLVDSKTGLVVNAEYEQKMTGMMEMTTKGKVTGKEK